ncbi:MAG TPA: permease prefix domain 1-containing protein [Fimbriimonadaceae bacterium]|nr:permease prefix domain 1-containing protein [Fimbriimonadaceae bacterium]
MAEDYPAYLERIQAGLRSVCGQAKTPAIFAEARAHLEEGIEELVARGMTRPAAEETIMARFGDADSVCRWYAEQHRRPSVWRASRWPMAAIGVSVLFWVYQNDILPLRFLAHFGSLIVMNTLLAVTIVLCFRCKRWISGVVVLASAAVYVVNVVWGCLSAVPVHWEHGDGLIARREIEPTMQNARKGIERNEFLKATFLEGYHAFQPEREPADGVGKFHTERGYLSPIYYQIQDPRVHVYFGDEESNGICVSYEEARNFWILQPSMYSKADGKSEPYYLAEAADELAQDRLLLRTLPVADQIPFREKFPVVLSSMRYMSFFLLGFGLIADVSGGILRTLAELVRRRSRGPLLS